MTDLKNILPPKLFEIVDRAGLSTYKQVLILSVWDIKKLTNLRTEDILLLKNIVADHVTPQSVPCEKLAIQKNLQEMVTTGCSQIDKMLNGGLRKGTITEIYGESGSGKTQISIQAAAHSWPHGSVFICTEDLFPVKRFEQIKQSLPNYNPDNDYGKNVFVEHVTEAQDLMSCVRVRLPKLLEKNSFSLIVIDSVAAPFRSEYTNYVQRAEELRELAISLMSVAQKHNLAVLCINQVTASFNDTDSVLPSLGLAWSNMVTSRLWLKKTKETISHNVPMLEQNVHIRELIVIFAPYLPNSVTKFIITPSGIHCI